MRYGQFFAAALLAFAVSFATTDAFAQKRLAFVVGNDSYQNIDTLKKAVNDARSVARGAQQIGFTVTLSENLSRRDFNAKFTAFEGSVGPGDTVFLFYSGHGIELDGANYLIPVDAPRVTAQQQALLKDESISTDGMIRRIKERGAALQVIVLDACRENPFRDASGRSLGPSGARIGPPPATRGLFMIYSAGNGEIALDRLSDGDADPNSVFTRAFLPLMTDPSRTLVSIAKETGLRVQQLSAGIGKPQFPGYYDQTDGDVFLARGAQSASAAAVTIPPPVVQPPPVVAQPPVVANVQPNLQKNLTPAPAPAPQLGGFIFEDSDRRLLTRDQLRGLSLEQLRIARNEIYARRGRFFQDKQLASYFSRMPWYKPYAWDVSLNSTEAANVKLIQSLER